MGNKAHSIGALKAKALRGEGDPRKDRALIRLGAQSTAILTGLEELSDWDDEELRRGQRRDKNGKWQGQPPKVVPKAVHDELVRRTLAKAHEELRDNLVEAVQALVEIVKGQGTEDKDKLKAISMIMDRVMGKTPDRIEFKGEMKKWEIALQAGIVPLVSDVDDAIIEIDSTEVEVDDDPFG